MEMADTNGQGAGGRGSNLRTALILLSVAAAFFLGIIAKHWLLG